MTDRILITGGTGYVGGRIAATLGLTSDCYLRIGTRRTHLPTPPWLRQGELVALQLDNDDEVTAACQGVDCVIHLAALDEIESAADPEAAFIVNSLGTLRLLRAAKKAAVRRFIYFSTAHVYGAPLAGRITETSVTRPQHPYAITHRAAEDFVLAANDAQELAGIVFRLSNSLGAPIDGNVNRWTLIANDLCRQAVSQQKLVLKTSGIQQRDFIALSDVERAVSHFLRLDAVAAGDGLYNLGGGRSISIREMADMIAERCQLVLGYRPQVVRPDQVPGEKVLPLDYRIDKLADTGFNLAGSIESEIDSTLRYCQQAFGGRTT